MLFRTRGSTAVAPGMIFRQANTVLRTHVPMLWTVDGIHDGTDGHRYAVLVSRSDPSRRKSVAVAALLDPALFEPTDA